MEIYIVVFTHTSQLYVMRYDTTCLFISVLYRIVLLIDEYTVCKLKFY
jgi:hypothetical protein